MSLDPSTVVNVTISRTTATVTAKGFGRAIILGSTGAFASDTARLYSSLSDVDVDFAVTDPEYYAAQAYFSQSPAPQDVYIGQVAGGDTPDVGIAAMVAAGYTDYYCILIVGAKNTSANILLMAAWNEAQDFKRIFLSSLLEAGILDSGSVTDTAYLAKASNYSRTSVSYSNGTRPYTRAAAWAGKQLPQAPGSSNYAFKTLVGEVADAVSTTQLAALEAKNANAYVSIGGVDVTQLGTMADGEFIDVIVGLDWLQSIMQQDIFALLATTQKVPFTDGGIAMVQAVMGGDLASAVAAGVLDSYVLPEVKASSYSSAQRQTRELTSLPFTGRLAGAVNKVTVSGNVTF